MRITYPGGDVRRSWIMPKGWRYESVRHSLAARGIRTRGISRDSLPFPERTYDLYDLGDVPEMKKYGAKDPDDFAKEIRKAWRSGDISLEYVWVYNFPKHRVSVLVYDEFGTNWFVGMYGTKSNLMKLLNDMISERDRITEKYPDGIMEITASEGGWKNGKPIGKVSKYRRPLPEYSDIERMLYEVEHSDVKDTDMILFTTTDSEELEATQSIIGMWEDKGRRTILSNISASMPEERAFHKMIRNTRDGLGKEGADEELMKKILED